MDEVYRDHHHRVFVTCQRFAAGDRQWALDRTQEVFIKLVEHADTVRDRNDPGGWLYRVAVNTCFMAMRSQRTATRAISRLLSGGPAPDVPAPDGQVGARRALTELELSLRELPPAQRALIVLVHVENKTQNEAAALLGMSKGQASKLLGKALRTLRAREWDIGDA